MEKRSLLQVNATIIAGLLILLTIQLVATDSILDLKFKSIFLNKEFDILLKDYPKIKADIEITEGKKNVTGNTDPETGDFVFSIPLPYPYLYAQEKEIEELFRENYRERVKVGASIQAYNELENFQILYANPIFLVSAFIVPFLISMSFELKNWFSKNEEYVSKISIWFTSAGIVIMLVFFVVGIVLLFFTL